MSLEEVRRVLRDAGPLTRKQIALPVNHDDGLFIIPYSEIKSIEVSEVKE